MALEVPNIIIYLNDFPYTLPLWVTVQLILELDGWSGQLPTPQRPPYTMTPTNDRQIHVRQMLLFHCYSYEHVYVNDQTFFRSELLAKYGLLGFYQA